MILVGEPVRSAGAEHTYNRAWLIGVVAGPVLLGVLAAAWMVTVADRLPAELATHWGSNGVDGYSPLWVTALIAILVGGGSGALLAGLGIASRGQSLMVSRICVGAGLGLGIMLTALFVAIVAGQLDLKDASQAGLSAPAMWAGAAVAVLVAVAAIWRYRPGEVDRRPGPEVQCAADALESEPVSADAARMAASGETLSVKVSMGPAKWCLSLGMGAVVGASVYFISPWLALLGVPVAALMWIFCQGTLEIGPGGTKVLASGFWKLMPLDFTEIRAATVEDVRALDYGGWGYRLGGGSIAFITASGPALVLETAFHQRCVVSMPDAGTAARACSLVTAYARAGGNTNFGLKEGVKK